MTVPQSPKMGRIELAILDKLSRDGGLTSREDALIAAYPELGQRPSAHGRPERAWAQRRARAEAATTRAIKSLELKGRLRSERNTRTGRLLLHLPGPSVLPSWEELARAEEDLAAHCRLLAGKWQELARRAAGRARTIRSERGEAGTEDERQADLEAVADLESGRQR